jgi:uncharacterized protein (TIGR04255 family)
MSIDALHPVAGNHAIQGAAFVFQWPIPLEQTNLDLVRTYTEQLKAWFPLVQEQKTVSIEIGEQGVRNQQEAGISGLKFLQPAPALGPAAIARAISVTKEQLVINVNDYTRWDEAWPRVAEWLGIILPGILIGRPINAAILQYTDQFEWRADPADMVKAEIFRDDSQYLTRRVFDTQGFWHVHQGFVDSRNEPLVHELIENVNVNMAESNTRRVITLFTSHHAVLQNPIWDAATVIDQLAVLMDDLHERNKDVMKDIFTEAVCQKINLL